MALNEVAVGRLQAALLRESGGRPLTQRQRHAARIALTREAERLSPRAGRAAAITEADLTLRSITRADGTVKPPKAVRKAAKAVKKAVKAARTAATAREAAEDALISRKITETLAARGIRETLTAASAPEASGGYEVAPLATGTRSPFWAPFRDDLPAGAAAAVTDPGKPLHALGADELHDYGKSVLTARGLGFGSPSWGG